jgi:TIR domain-containing protein
MKVFLSWSGDLSRGVASAIRRYLPCMLQDTVVFMSKHDLESGARWSHQLAEQLEHAEFGILCLTPQNIGSPWLLFEAGALTKHIEGRACGLLIAGLKPLDLTGPLSQFQNRILAADDFYQLLGDINGKLTKPLEDEQLQIVFAKFWPDLDKDCKTAIKSGMKDGSPAQQRDERDILDEILSKVRGIERTLDRPLTQYSQASADVPETLEVTAEHVIRHLNQRQQLILLELVNSDGSLKYLDPVTFESRHAWGDLQRLMASGLVHRTAVGYSITHETIARLVARVVHPMQMVRDASRDSVKSEYCDDDECILDENGNCINQMHWGANE